MFNNIQVTLMAFAGGITFGLVTLYALFFNGLLLGTIAGLAIGAGNGIAFLRLVSSHGPLEISCIVVGGVAGLRMGWALVRPGTLRRATSLRREAIPAVELAAGTVPWLVLCGFLEGFATGPELPVAVQTALGFRCVSCSGAWCSCAAVRARRATWPAGRPRPARPGACPAAPRAPARPRREPARRRGRVRRGRRRRRSRGRR